MIRIGRTEAVRAQEQREPPDDIAVAKPNVSGREPREGCPDIHPLLADSNRKPIGQGVQGTQLGEVLL